jgi:L-Ala-D/L-Glu epimerase
MKLNRFVLETLEIPFRVSFKHASAERHRTETIVAVAYDEDGIAGYGEGCPRSYVTGESITSCADFLKTHTSALTDIDSVETLRKFVSDKRPAIDGNAAAWCAIEMSILDLLGKTRNETVEEILGLPVARGEFRYTAVLGASSPALFQSQLARYVAIGFTDFKVKISGDHAADSSNLNAVRAALPDARIRLDANNLWDDIATASSYLESLPPCFWALEEPLGTRNYSGCSILADRFHCKVILDESFLFAKELVHLAERPEIWIPNIRVSKMGGILRSLAVAEACRAVGFKFILGAHVGETSLLARAAITVASAYRDSLITQEGAFGIYLLDWDIVDAPIMFGKDGLVHREPSRGPGMGLTVSLRQPDN